MVGYTGCRKLSRLQELIPMKGVLRPTQENCQAMPGGKPLAICRLSQDLPTCIDYTTMCTTLHLYLGRSFSNKRMTYVPLGTAHFPPTIMLASVPLSEIFLCIVQNTNQINT